MPDPPLPLLITGIAGVAGYNALDYFRRLYPGGVVGIRRVDNWPLSGDAIMPCDMWRRDDLKRLFDAHQFASVLSCEGSCALKSCQLDPAMAWRINVQSMESLLDCISGTSTRLVHMSIDLVFSGRGAGGHVESDPPEPVTVYGETMVAAEQLVARRHPNAAVLRISLPMGVSFNGHAGAIDWIQHRFAKRKPATLYLDEVRTPTYTDCLNEVCRRVLADQSLRGLYHAGGPRRLSLYEIAQIVNRIGGYDPRHLQGCPRIDAGPMPPRAGNVAMISTKLSGTLGYDPFVPWPIDPEFTPTHPEWHLERGTFQGSRQLLAEVLYRRP